MDALAFVLILGPLAAAILVALGPGWQLFNEAEPIPLRVHRGEAPAPSDPRQARPVEIHGARRVA